MREVDTGVLRGVTIRQRNATYLCMVLPDRKYVCEVFISTLTVRCYVREDVSCKNILEFPITKAKAGYWPDLVQAFCEKAVQHFPAPVRHKSVSIERHRRGW